MVVIWAITVLLVGLVILVMGVRGRRINDHPVCRGCQFDLVGIYPAAATCPECGRGLLSSMVRTGVRHRRRRMAVLGGLMALAGAIVAGGFGAMALSGPGHVKHAPAWWLAVEVRTVPKKASDLALTELISRIGNGKVSSSLTKRLVRQGLAEQGNRARRWNVLWGDLIEAAQSRGLTTPDQDAKFLRQAVLAKAWVQPRIHSGDVPRIRLDFAGSPTEYGRLGDNTRVYLVSSLTAATLDGKALPLSRQRASPGEVLTPLVHKFTVKDGALSEGYYKTAEVSELAPIEADPGRRTLKLTWDVSAMLNPASDQQAVTSWVVEQTAAIEVRRADEPLADLITDDAKAAALQKMFTAWATTSSANLHEVLRWKDLPAPMHYQVIARAEGMEYVGTLTSRRRQSVPIEKADGSDDLPDWSAMVNEAQYRFTRASGGELTVPSSNPSELWPERVDIVIVPDPEGAAREGILKIWGREIVLKDVQVRR